MKICEYCNNKHDGTYASGRFCSVKCARGFSSKEKRLLINEKVSKTLTGRGHKNVKLICKYCGKEFEIGWTKRNQKCCSTSCSSKYKWKDKKYRNKMSKILSNVAIKRHLNNDKNFGWQTRKNIKPSYPESIAIRCLNELKVNYEREHPFGKYFIDFAIIKDKIAIEIDGQQHNLKERIESDNKKDKLLKSEGWKIFRIKYPKENIRNKIKEIIKNEYGEQANQVKAWD